MSTLPKIICIVGPTASGKSELAVRLAKKISALGGPALGWHGAEIISADSRQVYRGLDIGTGKITKREMRGVPHHLLDISDSKKTFTAAQFKKRAEKAITDIVRRGKLPIVCGGTGFYADVLVNNLELPAVPPNRKLRIGLEKKSAEELFWYLQKLDKKRANSIDPHNPVRLIRAIEIAKALGTVPALKKGPRRYRMLWLGIKLSDQELRKRIHTRLLRRLRQGLVTEVKKLRRKGLSWKRFYDLGLEYRYVASHLKGELSKKDMSRKLERAIWQYAKRQKTWWSRSAGWGNERRIHWLKTDRQAEKLVKAFLTNP